MCFSTSFINLPQYGSEKHIYSTFDKRVKFSSLFVLDYFNPPKVASGSELRRISFCRLYTSLQKQIPPPTILRKKIIDILRHRIWHYRKYCVIWVAIRYSLMAKATVRIFKNHGLKQINRNIEELKFTLLNYNTVSFLRKIGQEKPQRQRI